MAFFVRTVIFQYYIVSRQHQHPLYSEEHNSGCQVFVEHALCLLESGLLVEQMGDLASLDGFNVTTILNTDDKSKSMDVLGRYKLMINWI